MHLAVSARNVASIVAQRLNLAINGDNLGWTRLKQGSFSMSHLGSYLGVLALALSAPAQAELISAKDPYAIARILKAENMRAIVHTPEGEAPFIESENDPDSFVIFFMDCDDENLNCKTIQFYTGYNNAKDTTWERINEWNRDHRFARVYRDDEGDTVMEMDLDLDFEGIPQANVKEALAIWLDLMIAFNAHIFPDGEG